MLGNSITVLNKSGKVVSNSKHLTGVWKEAKAAYQSRKAEIKAGREFEHGDYRAAQHGLRNLSLSDEHLPRHKAASRAGSSRSVAHSKSAHRRRASGQHDKHDRHHDHQDRGYHTSSGRSKPEPLQRAYTESAYANETVYSHPDEPPSFERPDRQLARRNTAPPRRSASYDENLAYGNLPPHLPPRPSDTEIELKGKMTVLNRLLEEANCLQYSATSMIEHLQRNPEALAAVGLTLAEISTLARRVGPIAFANMKTMFPAAIALLASPQFLIAGGVAVGVTVVMLGGYKIIKKAKAQKALEASNEMDELREIEGDLSGIELWRRGIADAHEDSVGTSVDGELITPDAALRQISDGHMQESNLKPKVQRAKSERSHRSHRSKSGSVRGHDHDARSERSSDSRRRRHSRQHGDSSGRADDALSHTSSSKKESTTRKAVGGLKMLFKGKSAPNLR